MHRRADDVAERDLAGALLAGRLSFDDHAASQDDKDRPGIWTPLILINLTVKWTGRERGAFRIEILLQDSDRAVHPRVGRPPGALHGRP